MFDRCPLSKVSTAQSFIAMQMPIIHRQLSRIWFLKHMVEIPRSCHRGMFPGIDLNFALNDGESDEEEETVNPARLDKPSPEINSNRAHANNPTPQLRSPTPAMSPSATSAPSKPTPKKIFQGFFPFHRKVRKEAFLFQGLWKRSPSFILYQKDGGEGSLCCIVTDLISSRRSPRADSNHHIIIEVVDLCETGCFWFYSSV